MKRDQEIFDLIEKEHQRQLKGMELIASENFVSDQVMEAMGSYLTNKYAEGYPGKRYYGGCGVVDQVEQLAIDRVCKLFGAEYANVQPHSGAQANAAVLLAVLQPGDTFMGLNLAHGGHLSHGSAVNTSGILYRPVGYDLNKETGRVDYDEMERLAIENKPTLPSTVVEASANTTRASAHSKHSTQVKSILTWQQHWLRPTQPMALPSLSAATTSTPI